MASTLITTNVISDNAITTAKIPDDAITSAKIADNAIDIARLNVSDGSNGQFLKTNGSGVLSFGSVASDSGRAYSDWAIKTGNYTMANKDQIIANSSSTITLTLPASPGAGDTVVIKNVGTGAVTIARNGSNIESAAQDGTLAATKAMQTVYVDSTLGWKEI